MGLCQNLGHFLWKVTSCRIVRGRTFLKLKKSSYQPINQSFYSYSNSITNVNGYLAQEAWLVVGRKIQ